jgi:hypothetical protein
MESGFTNGGVNVQGDSIVERLLDVYEQTGRMSPPIIGGQLRQSVGQIAVVEIEENISLHLAEAVILTDDISAHFLDLNQRLMDIFRRLGFLAVINQPDHQPAWKLAGEKGAEVFKIEGYCAHVSKTLLSGLVKIGCQG